MPTRERACLILRKAADHRVSRGPPAQALRRAVTPGAPSVSDWARSRRDPTPLRSAPVGSRSSFSSGEAAGPRDAASSSSHLVVDVSCAQVTWYGTCTPWPPSSRIGRMSDLHRVADHQEPGRIDVPLGEQLGRTCRRPSRARPGCGSKWWAMPDVCTLRGWCTRSPLVISTSRCVATDGGQRLGHAVEQLDGVHQHLVRVVDELADHRSPARAARRR